MFNLPFGRRGIYDSPQIAMGFLINQATHIESEVYRTIYRDIQYPALVPVDTSAPEWVQSVTYFSLDAVGAANWFSAKAQDVPRVELTREKFQTTVHMAAAGYGYDMEELAVAMMQGVNLSAEKAQTARRVAEEFIDRVVITGDTTKGVKGVMNQSGVTAGSAAATGTAGATTWASKTPDMVLADVNAALSGIFTGTVGIEMADTILLPYQQLLDINTRRIDAVNQTTILEWLRRNNIYTQMTNNPLTIRGVWGLETAGSGSTARMIVYRRDPSVLKFHMPMPFRFLPVWQVGPLMFEVPGIFRLGGVDVKRTSAMRYVDGI